MDDCEPVRFGNFDKGQQIQLAIEAQGSGSNREN
jgi:hypothetical protein